MTVGLALHDVRAGYGPVEVLHGVTMRCPRGRLTAVVGPNGAGKSTALAVAAGLVPARSGRVRFGDRDITGWLPYPRAAAGIVTVPQEGGVFRSLSVEENLLLFADKTMDVQPALDVFPALADRLPVRADSLSGGEQQMLALSRALLQEPSVLLVDELSFGLAPRVAAQLYDVVVDFARRGATVVLAEPLSRRATQHADVVYVLRRGRVEFAGEPAELSAAQLPAT